MTLKQFQTLQPISFQQAIHLWSTGGVYQVYSDGSETLMDKDGTEPWTHMQYAIERDEPLCLVHGEIYCTVPKMRAQNDGDGFCRHCGAMILSLQQYAQLSQEDGI